MKLPRPWQRSEDPWRQLYDAAFGSARPDATLEQFGRHGIDVSIWIDTMAEMIKGHDMGKFRELHQPARIKAANARVAEYRVTLIVTFILKD